MVFLFQADFTFTDRSSLPQALVLDSDFSLILKFLGFIFHLFELKLCLPLSNLICPILIFIP